MANDDPVEHDPIKNDSAPEAVNPAEPGGAKPRRRNPPPTIDLAARDVTPVPDDAATSEPPVEPTVEPAPAPAPENIDEPDAFEEAAAFGEAPPTAPREPRKLGIFGGLVVGVISGLLGGAVAVGVMSSFYGAEENIDAITDLEARQVDLRQRMETIEARSGAPAPAPVNAALPDELAARLDALEAGIGTLGARVNGLTEAPAAAPVAPAAPAATPEAVEAVATRLGALEQRVGELPPPAPPAPPAASPEDVAAVSARIAALESRLASVAATQQSSGNGAAQIVALSALRDAVVRGVPFETELKASRALLGAEAAELASFEAKAATGFASGPALAARLKAAATMPTPAPSASGASTTPPPNEGLFDRLVRSASGLVTIRRGTTDAAPTAATSSLSNAESALERGDLEAGLKAIASLPPAQRSAAAPVVADIEARQAALATLAGLNQRILSDLAGRTP